MNALSRLLAPFTFLRWMVLALALPVAAQAAGLNDTGITDCWNDTAVANVTHAVGVNGTGITGGWNNSEISSGTCI